MNNLYKKLTKWDNDFSDKHKWFPFVASIAFAGLALFRIGINDIWNYLMIIPLAILGSLIILTFKWRGQ